jgi:hypothetical protein
MSYILGFPRCRWEKSTISAAGVFKCVWNTCECVHYAGLIPRTGGTTRGHGVKVVLLQQQLPQEHIWICSSTLNPIHCITAICQQLHMSYRGLTKTTRSSSPSCAELKLPTKEKCQRDSVSLISPLHLVALLGLLVERVTDI